METLDPNPAPEYDDGVVLSIGTIEDVGPKVYKG